MWRIIFQYLIKFIKYQCMVYLGIYDRPNRSTQVILFDQYNSYKWIHVRPQSQSCFWNWQWTILRRCAQLDHVVRQKEYYQSNRVKYLFLIMYIKPLEYSSYIIFIYKYAPWCLQPVRCNNAHIYNRFISSTTAQYVNHNERGGNVPFPSRYVYFSSSSQGNPPFLLQCMLSLGYN